MRLQSTSGSDLALGKNFDAAPVALAPAPTLSIANQLLENKQKLKYELELLFSSDFCMIEMVINVNGKVRNC
jgi:hypothetical protein